jgi:hypothetical protein
MQAQTAVCEFLKKLKEISMKSFSSRTIYILTMLCLSLVIFGCGGGGSGSSSPTPTNDSVTTATFKVENIPVTSATEGKSSFKIKVTNKTTGAAVVGKTITLTPTMDMGSMKHSTPVDSFKDNGDGTYSWTVYYLMASTMANGTSMGTWELKFVVDGETAAFTPAVTMSMGTTPRSTLKGINDKIGSMGSTIARNYYLFNDGISGSTVKLFIAATDDSMMTKFPAVSVGSILHDQMNADVTVSSMSVEVSTDKTAWTALTHDGNGHWSKSGFTMLSAGSHLYVRLTVNGEQKTTDGAAVGTNNAYGDFTIAGM